MNNDGDTVAATIRDVARRAGVSTSTVSRVLNDTCAVNEDKRKLVQEAAEALGYVPNPMARSLLGKRTGGLGVLLPFVGAEFFSQLLTGLDEGAQEKGYFLVVSTSHRHVHEFRAAMRAVEQRVDGMIVMAPELSIRDADSIAKAKAPVVLVNTYVDDDSLEVINFDNHGGSYAVTRHLIELGHRRIALIKGPGAARDAQERARGYRAAMAEMDVDAADDLEVEGDYTQEAGYEAAIALLDGGANPTAIVAANDYCAMGAMRALHDRGVSIPEEIAVAGFDGIPSAHYTQPPLTTVQVPMYEIGRQAIGRLVDLLEGQNGAQSPRRALVPVELTVRTSTAGSGA